MENIDFKKLIEQPLRANDRRMIDAESCAEQAKQYYDSLPKATMDNSQICTSEEDRIRAFLEGRELLRESFNRKLERIREGINKK